MAEQRTPGRTSDPRVMRALAHPARITILEHLSSTGDVITATQVAELVGMSPSATSYHLRELAKVGLVEQAPSRGDGRERVWRSVSRSLSFGSEPGRPESQAAEGALVETWLARDVQRLREWLAHQHDGESADWREAVTVMSSTLLINAGELNELNERIRALVEPYLRRERQEGAPADARIVTVDYLSFPID